MAGPPFDLCILPGVLSSVPQPAMVLEKSLRQAKLGVLFDITLHGRLHADFADLNRWTLDEVVALTCECGFEHLTLRDQSASWVLCFAHREGVLAEQVP